MEKRKHIWAMLILLATWLFSTNAFAETVEIDGIYYNLVTKAKQAEVTENPNRYTGAVKIPEIVSYNNVTYSVTSIGEYAFFNCHGLTSVTIPNSIISIGKRAFDGCTGLTSISIPSSVTSIGERAFYRCTGLTSIKVETDNIIYDSRNNCNALIETATNRLIIGCKNTIIPNSVTAIGGYAFEHCSGLTSVTIPNSVKSIGMRAFYWCTGLTSVTIPNSVTSIGSSAFEGCTGLTSFTIPNSVNGIGSYAFYECTNLTSLIIGSGIKNISDCAFANCPELLDVYCYAEQVPNTASDAFEDSYIEFATLHIPGILSGVYASTEPWKNFKTTVLVSNTSCIDGVNYNINFETKTAEVIAKNDEKYSGNVVIPSSIIYAGKTYSVTSIGERAFYNCTNLLSIAIPSSLTRVKKGAFIGCQSLTKFIVADIAAYCGIIYDGDDYNGDFPLGIAHHLYCDENTEITELIIPEGVTKIETRAFRDAIYITSVVLPNTLTNIGQEAFRGMSGLASVTIPNSVTNIGNSAFSDCRSLTSIAIPNSVTTIEEFAFYDCRALTSISIGSGVASIGSEAFRNCNMNLTHIAVASENMYYDSRNNCNAIIETATDKLIWGCTNTIIPQGVKSIGSWALQWCNFEYIDIPSSVTSIEADALSHCTNLISIDIPAKVTKIEGFTFYNCTSLTTVRIPSSVTSIGERALYNCNNLSNIYCLSDEVPQTHKDAFLDTNITKITLHVPYGSKIAYEAVSPWKEFGKILEIPITITVGETGFATFCSPYALDFSEVEDIRAYIVSGFNQETGTLVLTRVTEVPAGEGLYIAGMPGNHEIPQTKTSMFYANLLKGVTEPTIISPTDGNYTNYILSNGSYGVGFYTLSTTGTLDGGKAYLQLPTASVAGVKALKIEFDENDDPTGIAITSASATEENTIYNLAGQRVSQPQKGINIINGKKIFTK